MIWLALLADLIFLSLIFWIFVVIFKLFFVKGYRDYPPYVPSFGQIKKEEFLRISEQLRKAKKSLKIIDPGCGTAELIIKLAKLFPQHKFVGIEWNKVICSLAKLRCCKLNNIEIICDDFFNYQFDDADIIVCFLIEPLMERFGEKIKKDCKNSVTVYSNTFEIPNLPLVEKVKTRKIWYFGNLYIYRK